MKAPTALFALLGFGVFIASAPSAISKNPTTFDPASWSTSDATKMKTTPTKQAREIHKMDTDLWHHNIKERGQESIRLFAFDDQRSRIACQKVCRRAVVRCRQEHILQWDLCRTPWNECINHCETSHKAT